MTSLPTETVGGITSAKMAEAVHGFIPLGGFSHGCVLCVDHSTRPKWLDCAMLGCVRVLYVRIVKMQVSIVVISRGPNKVDYPD